MTPDELMILVNGMALDRAMIAETLDDAPPWDTFALEDAQPVPTRDPNAAQHF
jgi:hypothetical protein